MLHGDTNCHRALAVCWAPLKIVRMCGLSGIGALMYESLWGQGTRDGGEEDCCCLGRRLCLQELQAELAYDPSSEAALARELRACMDASPRQAAAFDAITNAIDAGESKLFFVDGLGGNRQILSVYIHLALCSWSWRNCSGLFLKCLGRIPPARWSASPPSVVSWPQ